MSDEPDIIPPEAFGVASWFILRAIMASTPELAQEIFDWVLLSLERLQASEPDEHVAGLYRHARRLVDAALRTHTKSWKPIG
jgi:hypothetical protein